MLALNFNYYKITSKKNIYISFLSHNDLSWHFSYIIDYFIKLNNFPNFNFHFRNKQTTNFLVIFRFLFHSSTKLLRCISQSLNTGTDWMKWNIWEFWVITRERNSLDIFFLFLFWRHLVLCVARLTVCCCVGKIQRWARRIYFRFSFSFSSAWVFFSWGARSRLNG